MTNKMNEYTVEVVVSVYADSQGDAITEIEKRLKPMAANQDPYCVVVRESKTKRIGAARY